MLITFVIPAFNVADLIQRTLDSIFHNAGHEQWKVNAVVVDDGSVDGERLAQIVARYADASLVVHHENRGMCAARNTGIAYSKGDYVCILDADDELVPDWLTLFDAVVKEAPPDCQVIFASCRNQWGRITAEKPDYTGWLTLDDFLNERYSGEYLPIFRGDYVRKSPYLDLKLKKSCGIVSYINFAKDGPFWVSSKVLRIYHESRAGSVTAGWISPTKALETVRCYEILMEKYGELYRQRAPRVYRTRLLRMAVYQKLAGLPDAWKTFRQGASLIVWWESLGSAVMLFLGRKAAGMIAVAAKKIGLVRNYG